MTWCSSGGIPLNAVKPPARAFEVTDELLAVALCAEYALDTHSLRLVPPGKASSTRAALEAVSAELAKQAPTEPERVPSLSAGEQAIVEDAEACMRVGELSARKVPFLIDIIRKRFPGAAPAQRTVADVSAELAEEEPSEQPTRAQNEFRAGDYVSLVGEPGVMKIARFNGTLIVTENGTQFSVLDARRVEPPETARDLPEPLDEAEWAAVERWIGREPHQHSQLECDAAVMAVALQQRFTRPAAPVSPLEALLAKWRVRQSNLDETVVGMQRQCADELAAALAVAKEKP